MYWEVMQVLCFDFQVEIKSNHTHNRWRWIQTLTEMASRYSRAMLMSLIGLTLQLLVTAIAA